MQRVPRHLQRLYPVVRLYLDDVDELLTLFQEHCEDVTITAEGYKVQSVGDLKRLAPRRIRRLAINGWTRQNTNLNVDLRPYRATLYLSQDDDTLSRGAFTQIDAILKRRAPVLQFVMAPATLISTSVVLSAVACAVTASQVGVLMQAVQAAQTSHRAVSADVTGLVLGDLWRIPLTTGLFAYSIWAGITNLRHHSIVYLRPWRERTTFWERNKEAISRDVIVGVGVFIITSCIAFAIGYIFGVHR